MTAYTDFVDKIKATINESDPAMNVLVPAAIGFAVKSLERKYKFAYMRAVEYYKLKVWGDEPYVVQTIVPGVPVVFQNTVQEDNQINIGWFDPSLLMVPGDWIKISGVAGGPYEMLEGKYAKVVERLYNAFFLNYVVEVQSDLGVPSPQTPVYNVVIEKLSGDPTAVGRNFDTGLVDIGRRLKYLEVLDLCDPDDYKKVLKKNLTQLDVKTLTEEAESWQQSDSGREPQGYILLGAAEIQDPMLVGTFRVGPENKLLLLRPKPDKAYWLRAVVYRYSTWPQDDHWLLAEGEDVLFWQTILEIGPGLRDEKLIQAAGLMLSSKLADLGLANIYLRESGDTGAMRYDPNR